MIKFHLQKLERSLVFQILDQKDIIPRSFDLKGIEVSINSYDYPEIEISKFKSTFRFERNNLQKLTFLPEGNSPINSINIKLRGGNTSRDFDVITIPFKNNDTRDKVYDILIESFAKYKKIEEVLKNRFEFQRD